MYILVQTNRRENKQRFLGEKKKGGGRFIPTEFQTKGKRISALKFVL